MLIVNHPALRLASVSGNFRAPHASCPTKNVSVRVCPAITIPPLPTTTISKTSYFTLPSPSTNTTQLPPNMGRIEEIPDEADLPKGPAPTGVENMPDLNSMIARAAAEHFGTDSNGNPSMTPTLPPDVAAVKSTTADEFIRQLNKMPLFMTELDETGEDDSSPNEALEAIRALQYEGPPEEIAANFKVQGNEHFKAKHYKDARAFYTKALAVEALDREIELACLGNRAQCNIELGNYGKAVADCRRALQLQPMNAKHWYRAARAMSEISKLEEAKACIENARQLLPTHTQIEALEKKIVEKIATRDRRLREMKEREEKEKLEKRKLAIATQARGFNVRGGFKRPDGRGLEFEEPGNVATQLTIPIVAVYYTEGADLSRTGQPGGPESDLVERVPESATVGDTLREVLSVPLPWDQRKDFAMLAGVEVYAETETSGLVKAGVKVSLLELLGGGKVVLVDGVLALYIVPKRLNKTFIEAWKKQKMRKA